MKEHSGSLEIVDSQNRQPDQNNQVDTYITKGVNALIVNPVDRTAAAPLMLKAKAKGRYFLLWWDSLPNWMYILEEHHCAVDRKSVV